jgi:hypothetical protein
MKRIQLASQCNSLKNRMKKKIEIREKIGKAELCQNNPKKCLQKWLKDQSVEKQDPTNFIFQK